MRARGAIIDGISDQFARRACYFAVLGMTFAAYGYLAGRDNFVEFGAYAIAASIVVRVFSAFVRNL